MKVARCRAALL